MDYFTTASQGYCRAEGKEGQTLGSLSSSLGVNALDVYYEVTAKKEKVNKKKKLVCVKNDDSSVLDDDDARKLLGIEGVDSIMTDSICSTHRVFVASTSTKRGLKQNQRALFRINRSSAANNGKSPAKTEAVPKESPKKSPAKTKPKSPAKTKPKSPAKTKRSAPKEVNDSPPAKRAKKVDEEGFTQTSGSPLYTGSFPFGLEWKNDCSKTVLALTSDSLKGSKKIVAFDMDHTLIKPKSGKKFASGPSDWVWWNSKVVPTLQKLAQNGYKLMIFTNQAGIEKKKVKPTDVTQKIMAMVKDAKVPIEAFACTHTDHWRKPHSTMWEWVIKHKNGGVEVDPNQCIYVGDAAGRPKGWKKGVSKDFGCGDRKFGHNNGIHFQTPEEFFLNESPVPFEWRTLDPVAYLKQFSGDETGFAGSSITKKTQELVLFNGSPACGKSTFAHTHFIPAGYKWVNRDTLKTPAKCLKAVTTALASGKSVCVDNTLPRRDDRNAYITAAKKAGVSVRCFIFQVPRNVAEHLNFYREALSEGKRRRVPGVGFNMFKSKNTTPALSEGFSEICTVTFVPKFKKEADKQLFLQWTE